MKWGRLREILSSGKAAESRESGLVLLVVLFLVVVSMLMVVSMSLQGSAQVEMLSFLKEKERSYDAAEMGMKKAMELLSSGKTLSEINGTEGTVSIGGQSCRYRIVVPRCSSSGTVCVVQSHGYAGDGAESVVSKVLFMGGGFASIMVRDSLRIERIHNVGSNEEWTTASAAAGEFVDDTKVQLENIGFEILGKPQKIPKASVFASEVNFVRSVYDELCSSSLAVCKEHGDIIVDSSNNNKRFFIAKDGDVIFKDKVSYAGAYTGSLNVVVVAGDENGDGDGGKVHFKDDCAPGGTGCIDISGSGHGYNVIVYADNKIKIEHPAVIVTGSQSAQTAFDRLVANVLFISPGELEVDVPSSKPVVRESGSTDGYVNVVYWVDEGISQEDGRFVSFTGSAIPERDLAIIVSEGSADIDTIWMTGSIVRSGLSCYDASVDCDPPDEDCHDRCEIKYFCNKIRQRADDTTDPANKAYYNAMADVYCNLMEQISGGGGGGSGSTGAYAGM